MNSRFVYAVAASVSSLMVAAASGQQDAKVPLVKVGHVNHDHQLALYAGLDNAEALGKKSGITAKVVKDRETYELFDGNRKVADVQVVKVGGASKMPTALAQDVVDIAFGGAVSVLAAVDNGLPVRIVAPLHSKGNMLVVKPAIAATNWAEFVAYVKQSAEPVRIGYKEPAAVAQMAMESALKKEGISFSGDLTKKNVKVHMINTKGGEKLNSSLSGGLVDAYAGNNPFPALGLEQGILKVVCSLDSLPGGKFSDMPCCIIAASEKAIKEKKEALTCLLALFVQGTDLVNSDKDAAVKSACRWLGTSEKVERSSIPTSCYSMKESKEWHDSMGLWLETMSEIQQLQGKLKGMKEADVAGLAYDFSLLHNAAKRTGN